MLSLLPLLPLLMLLTASAEGPARTADAEGALGILIPSVTRPLLLLLALLLLLLPCTTVASTLLLRLGAATEGPLEQNMASGMSALLGSTTKPTAGPRLYPLLLVLRLRPAAAMAAILSRCR
jgi:hypothetical protein